jgi:hypothetical protein
MRSTHLGVVVAALAAALPIGARADEPDVGAGARAPRSADLDGDGRINESEREAGRDRARQLMVERFDANGNGVLDPAELDEARAAARTFRALVKGQIDTNDDGRVDRGERRDARTRTVDAEDRREERLLERYDTNRNGILDADEETAARSAGEEVRQRTREKLDVNGDGTIDASEREAARAAAEQRQDPADSDESGTLSAQERRQAREAFVQRFDLNRNGRLDPPEEEAARDTYEYTDRELGLYVE